MTLDVTSPQFSHDPYPTYAALRKDEPVPLINETRMGLGKAYLVTRYEDVITVLKDPRFSNDSRKIKDGPTLSWWMPKSIIAFQNFMLSVDDPDHRRLRDLVHKAFTPKMIQGMNARIERIADDLLDAMATRPNLDLIHDYALPIPLVVISEMMGVPEKDRMQFHKWMNTFLSVGDVGKIQMVGKLIEMLQMFRFFKGLIKQRRKDPQDDLITALVQAEYEGDRLSDDEVIPMVFLLLLAGHETTVNLIGSGTLALLENPDQLRKLQQHPELIDSAIEELLRFTNPVEQPHPRFTLEDVELSGQRIPKGSKIVVGIASANRDESVFPNANQLDIERSPNKHVAFGLGIHYCLGAPLARMEGKIALQKLLARYPNMQLGVTPDQVQWRSAMGVRGLKVLPVRLS